MNKININTQEQQVLCLEYSENKEQLQELLKDLKIEVEFLGLKKHFESDTEKREIVRVFLTRNKKETSFDFGLSLKDSAKIALIKATGLKFDYNMLFDVERLEKMRKGYRPNSFRCNINEDNIYKALKCFFHSFGSFNYAKYLNDSFSGCFAIGRQKELFSTLNDLLYSVLCSCQTEYYCSKNFQDFCNDFGYNSDSIRYKKLWENCLNQSYKLEQIFNQNEVEYLPC